jgi:polysaccharide biosynthesis protein PslH
MEILLLTPEPPYPLNGGGAFRTASLLHYFARFAQVDLVLISDSGRAAEIPPGLVRSQQVIPLAKHNRGVAARYFRNARRAMQGIPPLVDRVSDLEVPLERAIGGKRYDIGILEHFWCAPYVDLAGRYCAETVLDLHNIESMLHERCAAVSGGLIRRGHRRFAAASRKLESALLPRFSAVLAASEEDARLVRTIAPAARVHVYPNAVPRVDTPHLPECARLVFSGNFEYHPNIDAVGFLMRDIWPKIRSLRPELRLRLVGRGDRFIRHLLPAGPLNEAGIEVTGPVEDARAEIAQAQIVVAPLRTGSGTRVKILEAWAAARCVVATPLAAEGLDALDGFNIALESDPGRFAARIADLLRDDELRQRLGLEGRRTFHYKYAWDVVWKLLDIELQLTRRSELSGYTGNF